MTFPIVGLCGQAGSGKDLVADFFVEKGFAKVAFSDPMKRFVQYLFDLDDEQLWGPSETRNEELAFTEEEWIGITQRMEQEAWDFVEEMQVSCQVPALLGLWDWLGVLYHSQKVSPRIFLQTLGTEWGRTLDPLVWVDYLHRVIRPQLEVGCSYSAQEGAGSVGESFAGIIIPDHRFANEITATREVGGYMIRVHRPGRPQEMTDPGIQGHASEKEQETLAADFFHSELLLPEGLDRARAVLEDFFFKHPWGVG